jgi:hypothetical protein
MRGILKKLPEQAVRIIIVFIVLAGALFVVWQFLLPPELKEKELQKTATLEREAAREVKYAGAQACGECHDKESNMKKGGYHRDLTCESCHGAAQKHVDNPTGVKPSSPKKRDYCSFCHNYNSSRPSGFPQINPVTHNPRKPCIPRRPRFPVPAMPAMRRSNEPRRHLTMPCFSARCATPRRKSIKPCRARLGRRSRIRAHFAGSAMIRAPAAGGRRPLIWPPTARNMSAGNATIHIC